MTGIYSKKWGGLIFFVCLLLLAAGCAPKTIRPTANAASIELEAKKQRQLALQKMVDYSVRLADISYPMKTGSVDLCGKDIGSDIGAVFANKYSFGEDLQDAAVENLRAGNNLKVIHVVPGGAASLGGMLTGDELVTVGSDSAPIGNKASIELAMTLGKLPHGSKTTITVRRDDADILLEVQPKRSCTYPVLLVGSDDINAYADGSSVYITRGMMRFTQNEEQLALIVGHELAHNAMGHIRSKKSNYWLGTVVDLVAAGYGVDTQNMFGKMAANAYSQDFESEADYVGLYFVARAGYKIEGAPNFWREMAAAHPAAIATNHAASHPATPARFVMLEKTVSEIQEKLIKQSPLNPRMKK